MGPECSNYQNYKGSGHCIIAKGHPHQLHRVLNNTEVKERNTTIYRHVFRCSTAHQCSLAQSGYGMATIYTQVYIYNIYIYNIYIYIYDKITMGKLSIILLRRSWDWKKSKISKHRDLHLVFFFLAIDKVVDWAMLTTIFDVSSLFYNSKML